MRGKDLLECMEQIDDALIEEALEPAAFPRRNNTIIKWSMAAACVAVIGISAAAFWSHQNIKEEQMDGNGIVTQMAMDNAAGSNNSADSSSDDDSLTAGAVTENQQTADSDIAAPADLCALPTAEVAAGAGSSSDRGNDAAARDSTADAASGAGNIEDTAEKKEEKVVTEQETTKFGYTIINDYYGEKDGSVYDYPIPGKGEFFCYRYLQETMEHYADNPTYVYDVVICIYGDVAKDANEAVRYDDLSMSDDSGAGSEMIEQEYQRLTELGYTVRLSEDFQLTGTFTKEELDTFQAFPEYGYTFRFANEY